MCFLCSRKEKLDKVTTVFRSSPEFILLRIQRGFLEKGSAGKKTRFIEKIRSLITQWDFMPVYYPATAVFLIGLCWEYA